MKLFNWIKLHKAAACRQKCFVYGAIYIALATLLMIVFINSGKKTRKQHTGKKMIVFSCTHEGCGGWADRQKGIVGAYVIAAMLGRDFKIKVTFPCNLDLFLTPRKVDWRLTAEQDAEASEGASLVFMDIDEVELFRNKIASKDDLENQLPDDVTSFSMNMEMVQYLQNHTLASRLPWLRDKTVPEVYQKVLKDLFQLVPEMQKELQQLKDRVPHNVSLVCAQLRVGSNGDFLDIHQFHTVRELYQIFSSKFLDSYSNASSYRVFIASDSLELIQRARWDYPDVVLPSVPGPITHTDKNHGQDACQGLRKAILDQYALSTCDVLAVSDSGLGKIASFMRGRDDQLFLMPFTGSSEITAVKRSTQFTKPW